MSPKGLLVFDLHAGGPPEQILWPATVDFRPFDMAPAPDGGLWILDRERRAYWALDCHLKVIRLAPPAVIPAQSIAKIKADILGFKMGSAATAEQKQQFIKDLAMAARSTKPSLPTVTKFVDSLTTGLSEVLLTADQQGRLAQNIESVLNSKPLPATQFDAIIADVQAIMQVGSLKRTSAATIANDLKAVGAEVRR